MKILIFTSIFPYPLNEGGKVAQFGFLEYLCREHDVVLVVENNYEGLLSDAKLLNQIIPLLRIEPLSIKKPVVNKGVTAFILKMVEKVEWRLKKRLSSKYRRPLRIIDNNFFINPVQLKKAEIIHQFVEVVKKEKPDLVQIDFINNADLANILPPCIPKILIHHDLRFATVQQAARLEGLSDEYSKYLSRFVCTVEAAFLNKFNAIITFSTDDRDRLLPTLNDVKTVSIPFPVLDKNIKDINDSPYTIRKLVFVGPEHHLPNYDSVEWYAKTMEQLIYKKFNLKLYVVGRWSMATINHFSGNKGIEFMGFVDDIEIMFKNAVMLVPLRIGSGIRTKLLEAFAYGVPVISTTLGCEGLGTESERELMIANTPEQFVFATEKLLNSPNQVNSLRLTANRFIKENYSQKTIFDKRMIIYEQAVNKELV